MSNGHASPFQFCLDGTPANFTSLTPTSFLEHAALVYPDRLATVQGSLRRTWAETYARCRRFASALHSRGIGKGDTVSVMLPNIAETFECHFGVPMSGAVLNTLNVRLDAEAIAFVLEHADTKVLITEREFSETISRALVRLRHCPLVIDVDDPSYPDGTTLGSVSYEALLKEGDPDFDGFRPEDEWEAISLNYTSGISSNPTGVVYHHRGAYLNALRNVVSLKMPVHPVYLWALPTVQCNGWNFPWTLAAAAGTSIWLRHVRAETVLQIIADEKVTNICGAPRFLNMLANAPTEPKVAYARAVQVMISGATPPASVAEGVERMGFEVTHVSDFTETPSPCIACETHEYWEGLRSGEKAVVKARQGVRRPSQEGGMVADAASLQPVPKDSETISP